MGKVRSWLLWNLFVIRPLCSWLSKRSFSGWRCPVSKEWSRTNPGLNTTGLQVIVAGIGKDGTTSMQAALATLGFRAFSAHEITYYMRDINAENVTPADMVGPLRLCGVSALLPQNFIGLVPELVPVSPDVKIILMQREWESWRRAMGSAEGVDSNKATPAGLSLALFLPALCHWLPLGLLWPGSDRHAPFVEGGVTSWFIKTCLYEDDFDSMQSRKATRYREDALANRTDYEKLSDMVRSLVPPAQLLDFDVRRHGWPELCAFLGRDPPPVGTAFPNTMSGTLIMQTAMLALAPGPFRLFLALLLASLVANIWAFSATTRALRRWRPASTPKSD
mmetsp:Transcript_53182/g.154822  ORF Transcript_53182/g.154822 Transcript_53182/m.154822 type:complete len:335 (+) Transcript_53182:155-1159(+)